MKHFPAATALFEAGLVLVAIGLGWLLKSPPLATFRFEGRPALLGIAATLPPLAVFWLCLKCPWRPLAEIARITDEMLVPLFRDCWVVELAVIAALAGIGEEMLFRGVIQSAAAAEIGGERGVWIALLIASALFGLLHPITPAYAILAGLIGLYLGALWLASGNLLVPIVAHGVYDFLALAYLVKVRGSRSHPGATLLKR
jgi:uncharacterized protein